MLQTESVQVNKVTEMTAEERRQLRHEKSIRRKRKHAIMWILALATAIIFVLGLFAAKEEITPLELPESVQVQPTVVADCYMPVAQELVSGLEGTQINVDFLNLPDLKKLGEQEVTLLFTKGAEKCFVKTTVYVFHLEKQVTVKMGDEPGSLQDFVADETVNATFAGDTPEQIPAQTGGIFELAVSCGGREYPVQYVVSEDIAPQGKPQKMTIEAGTLPEASVFVNEIIDHSPVTVSYAQEPDFALIGQHKVMVILTDIFGNATEIQAVAEVVPAENGPQFTGLKQMFVSAGDAISYKSGVTCTDLQDGALEFTVDNSHVDPQTPGRYTAYYSATDADGNRIVVPRTIVVEGHTEQTVRKMVQDVLKDVISSGMSRNEKIYAIYEYVRYSISYSGRSDKSSIENAAYEGLTTGRGDCYTYYALVRMMLDLSEIENVEVTRVGGTSHHWWNLVQFEDGKYYHMDASPHRLWVSGVEPTKMTEADLVKYTENSEVAAYRPNYYVYDHSLPQYENIIIAQ